MASCILYYTIFITIFWIKSTFSMILLNKNPIVSINSDTSNDIAEFILSKGYLPNEKDLPKSSIIKNVDSDVTYLLSKLSDEDLIKLLNEQPNRNEYDLRDLVKIGADSKQHPNLKPIVNFEKSKSVTSLNAFYKNNNKNKLQNGIFRLENREVDPFATSNNKDIDPQYVALQKLYNLLYSRPTEMGEESKNEDDNDKKELLFDILVSQLKTLCCNKNKQTLKKKDKSSYKLKSLLNDFVTPSVVQKTLVPSHKSSMATLMPSEYMFLILNDEIKSNDSDGLILVDPNSLGDNSSVLLLGPIGTPLSDAQLKLAMSRISKELSEPEYLPLLQKLSDGTMSDENIRLVNSLITGPKTRRYIKPHRCNHQSKLVKVYGGPKWLICTGYLNINTPSLYD